MPSIRTRVFAWRGEGENGKGGKLLVHWAKCQGIRACNWKILNCEQVFHPTQRHPDTANLLCLRAKFHCSQVRNSKQADAKFIDPFDKIRKIDIRPSTSEWCVFIEMDVIDGPEGYRKY